MLSLQIEWSHNSFHILFAYSIQQEYGHSLAKWSQRIIFELLKFHARSFLLTYKIQIHARPESFKGIFNFKELQVEVLSYDSYRNNWWQGKKHPNKLILLKTSSTYLTLKYTIISLNPHKLAIYAVISKMIIIMIGKIHVPFENT